MLGDWMFFSPERSAPSYIGSSRIDACRLELSWHDEHWRVSVAFIRNATSWLRPPLRSTVTAIAIEPCRSMLSTWCLATSNLLVAYSCDQIGRPRAAITSVTDVL